MFRPQLLAIIREFVRFLACAANAWNCMVGIMIKIIIIIIIMKTNSYKYSQPQTAHGWFWSLCSWDRASLEQRCKQPTRWNKFRLLIFLIQLYMFRATNPPIPRSTFWLYIQLLVQCSDIAADRWQGWDGTQVHLNLVTGRQQYRCTVPKAVYTVKKCYWRWASLSPETCRAELKRSINGICCILLVAYIVRLHVKYRHYFCHILTKLEFSRQGFEKVLKYQISWKSALWEPSCFTRSDRRTDTTKLLVANKELLCITQWSRAQLYFI